MKIQAINNYNNQPNFGARIKINKAVADNLFSTSVASGAGATASAAGALSIGQVSDPAHHIYLAAKAFDGAQASTGAGLIIGGGSSFKMAADFFKSSLKDLSKSNSKKIPS